MRLSERIFGSRCWIPIHTMTIITRRRFAALSEAFSNPFSAAPRVLPPASLNCPDPFLHRHRRLRTDYQPASARPDPAQAGANDGRERGRGGGKSACGAAAGVACTRCARSRRRFTMPDPIHAARSAPRGLSTYLIPVRLRLVLVQLLGTCRRASVLRAAESAPTRGHADRAPIFCSPRAHSAQPGNSRLGVRLMC